MIELLQNSYELYKIIREDPWIGWALAAVLVAGAVAAILIRKFRREEFLRISK